MYSVTFQVYLIPLARLFNGSSQVASDNELKRSEIKENGELSS